MDEGTDWRVDVSGAPRRSGSRLWQQGPASSSAQFAAGPYPRSPVNPHNNSIIPHNNSMNPHINSMIPYKNSGSIKTHTGVIWGKQHIAEYVMEPSFPKTRKHRKRAVVFLTKARNILTNRTKKARPHQTQTGGIYPSGWINGAVAQENSKVCTRDTSQTCTMFLQGSLADLQGHLQQSILFLGFE